MKSLYLDCENGISGDMIVAALLDAGADEEKLMRALNSVNADGFSIKISRVTKSGLDCCDFDVVLDKKHDNHDHDMGYLYGEDSVDASVNHLSAYSVSAHGHSHGKHHHDHMDTDGDLSHNHAHSDDEQTGHYHTHSEDGHHHFHRTLSDVEAIIDKTDATDGAKALAKKIFLILAEAEAKAHATTVDKVHFHEVGAIDSIADIIAAAVCFDDLDIGEVIIPRLCDGHGSVRCQHGVIPVPVPAVMNIAEMHHLPLSITEKKGEYVTPTGAAFVAAVITGTKLPDTITPVKTGMGAGKREYAVPGILRAVLYE